MSKITEQLFLGSGIEAADKVWMKEKFVSHIINCTKEHRSYFPADFNYLKLNLLDSSDQSLYHVFDRVYEYIITAISNGGTVFIHCHAGVSRSPSMAIYYVMRAQNWGFKRAISYVKTLHPKTDPNPGFIQQLISVSPEEMSQNLASRTMQAVENFYHPYDIRTRTNNVRSHHADFSRPRMIESRGEILRKFVNGEGKR